MIFIAGMYLHRSLLTYIFAENLYSNIDENILLMSIVIFFCIGEVKLN